MPRCDFCAKKLKLVEETTGKCRCGKCHCVLHREPSTHNCAFDYHQAQKEMLTSNMQAIVVNKVTGF